MKGWRQFRIVMQFEFMKYMHSKIYVVVSLILACLIVIGLSIPALLDLVKSAGLNLNRPTAKKDIVRVIDRTDSLDPAIFALALPDIQWERAEVQQEDSLIEQVDDEQIKALLVIENVDNWRWIVHRIDIFSDPGLLIQNILQDHFTRLKLSGTGLSEQQVTQLMLPAAWTVEETVQESGKSNEQTYVYTYLLLFLLYFTVMMYGQMVASAIASEKSNRAMELLITSARPLNLMFGKVIGSGLAGLAQIALLLVSAGAAYRLNAARYSEIAFVKNIFAMPVSILIYTIVFYLTGYFAYAFLYGALGSLVSRTEDINTSIMPVMLLFIAAYIVSFSGMMSPEATFIKVFSFVPLIAPMTMFVRICMTDVPLIEIALSLAVQILSIGLIGWLAARIYKIGVLMYGKPPRLATVFKMMKKA